MNGNCQKDCFIILLTLLDSFCSQHVTIVSLSSKRNKIVKSDLPAKETFTDDFICKLATGKLDKARI